MEDELDFVTFTDEEGKDYELAILNYFEHEDEMYALLFDPADADDEEAEVEVYIMKAEGKGEGDEVTFVPADEDKLDELIAIADELLNDMQTESLDDECSCGCGCTEEDCAHEHHEGCDCGCGKDDCYDDGKPCHCSGE